MLCLASLQVVLDGGERLEYGVCVWSTGNAARPIVQAVASQIEEQREFLQGRNPASTKLAVDPFLRIVGARDAIAVGDCSRCTGRPLPATAQVGARI
jgi:NADH:ubiquinone reductase (non-electrogenic)